MSEKHFFDLNYYEVLKVDENASIEQIRRAYFKMIKQYHGDIDSSEDYIEKFRYISEAYQVLINPNERTKYDAFIKECKQNNSISYFKYESTANYFDVTRLDDFIKSKFSKKSFKFFLDQLQISQIYLLYEYFWLSFWLGECLSEMMLIKNNVTKIYRLFLSHQDFINHVHSLIDNQKQINEQTKLKVEADNKVYVDAITNFYNQLEPVYNRSLKYKKKKEKALELEDAYINLIDTINADNIFDDETIILYSLLHPEITINLFNLMSRIYKFCERHESKLKNSEKRLVQNNRRRKLNSRSIIVITCIIAIIFAGLGYGIYKYLTDVTIPSIESTK